MTTLRKALAIYSMQMDHSRQVTSGTTLDMAREHLRPKNLEVLAMKVNGTWT